MRGIAVRSVLFVGRAAAAVRGSLTGADEEVARSVIHRLIYSFRSNLFVAGRADREPGAWCNLAPATAPEALIFRFYLEAF